MRNRETIEAKKNRIVSAREEKKKKKNENEKEKNRE